MKEHGLITICDGLGKAQELPTYRCPHCSRHFTVVKGSGIRRGWCFKCQAITCGEARCRAHLQIEKKLELIESGKLPLIKL